MTILTNKNLDCLLEPLHEFGDHNLGFMGCLWCPLRIKCVRFNPTVGRSVLFREANLTPRLDKIIKKGEKKMLDKDQKRFIRKKVKELSCIKKVKELYSKDCSVDNYAKKVARKWWGRKNA